MASTINAAKCSTVGLFHKLNINSKKQNAKAQNRVTLFTRSVETGHRCSSPGRGPDVGPGSVPVPASALCSLGSKDQGGQVLRKHFPQAAPLRTH